MWNKLLNSDTPINCAAVVLTWIKFGFHSGSENESERLERSEEKKSPSSPYRKFGNFRLSLLPINAKCVLAIEKLDLLSHGLLYLVNSVYEDEWTANFVAHFLWENIVHLVIVLESSYQFLDTPSY